MSTLRGILAKLALPLVGVWLVLVGVEGLTSLTIAPVLMAILALVAGVCCLCAS